MLGGYLIMFWVCNTEYLRKVCTKSLYTTATKTGHLKNTRLLFVPHFVFTQAILISTDSTHCFDLQWHVSEG